MSHDRSGRKIRISRPGTAPRRTSGGPGQAIRVSHKPVRPVAIHYPVDGATVEATSVSMTGSANPGDTLRLEGPDLTSVTCKVSRDGSWAMPEVVLSSGSHALSVVDTDHPSKSARVQFLVSALRPISIVAPLQGETLEARLLELTGKASPQRLVCLRLGRTTLTERADGRGSFRFRDVELTKWGTQRISLYYAEDPSQGASELILHWPGLDLPSQVDPVTRAHLEPGADVVRCVNCYTYCYRATWNQLRRCPRCADSTEYWQRSATKFHTPRRELASE